MERKKLLVGIFLSFILITSVLGFVIPYATDNNDTIDDTRDVVKEINGIKIERVQQGTYLINRNGIQVVFNSLPEELNEIKIPEFSFITDKVYVIFDPENQDTNMNYLLGKVSTGLNSAGHRTVFACSKEENCDIDIPVKDCSEYAVRIVRNKNNESKIYNNNRCLVLQGDDTNLNNFVDKLNYKFTGVE